ncbi:hypothetical protein Tco_0874016 [Tanacetum coccineum]|uniref:Reverse transcriptase zinc-binding domain-containing protein n=1 Tax=Tanacetum coccineum TaxID=301880 RepID=A0ABQ5BKF2_9ASTR
MAKVYQVKVTVPVKSDMSWGWRKLLQLRKTIKPCFWVKLGNGLSTSLWYDRWSSLCPLITFLSPRDITREGFHLQNKVADLIVNGVWAWLHKAPDIGTIVAPVLDVLQTDVMQWRDHNGTLSSFSVAKAWEAIRPRADMDLVPPVMHDIILHCSLIDLRCDLKGLLGFGLYRGENPWCPSFLGVVAKGVEVVRFTKGDKEVIFQLGGQGGDGGACKVLGWLLGDMVVRS